MAVNVVSFSFSWCSTGGPGVHSDGCWLSLLHLISNFSGPQTPSGFPRALSAECGFPYHISSITPSPTVTTTVTWLLSWLSYIIVQRPLDRPLDLWNRMFDRHQAEITVMQFTGHSLPVRQSIFYLVPFYQPIFLPRDFLSKLPLDCVTSFRCITLEWHFWPSQRPKYNTRAPTDIIDITVAFMFHSFFSSLARSNYLSLFSFSLIFTLWPAGTTNPSIRQVLFFFLHYH